ncbi:carbohydrate kinase family protein, partial [Candidatus Peregrinibacteria bacterium]|nr:carbohydrate kinase family protein [Candidatus Peregrinibacteria bacterium]
MTALTLKPMSNHNKILVTGSLAYDHLFFHDGVFRDVVLAEHLHHLNVCFLIKERRTHFGGTGGNISYNLQLL